MIDRQLSPAPLPPPPPPSRGRDRRPGRTVLLVLALVLGAPLAAGLVLALLVLTAGAVAGAAAGTSEGLHDLASGATRSAQTAPAHPQRPQPAAPQQAGGTSTGEVGDGAPVPPPASEGADGAVAVARHYVAAYQYGFRTGDPTPVRQAALSSCTSCANRAQEMAEWHQSGVRVDGVDLRLVSLEPTVVEPAEHPTEVLVHAVVDVGPAEVTTAKGTRWDVVSGPAESDIALVWDGSRWRVAGTSGDGWMSLVHLAQEPPQQS